MLLVLNLPLIGMCVQVLKVPYKILFPLILLFCLIGAYSVANSVFDIYVMLLFGMIGYLMKKYEYEGRRSSWPSSLAPCSRTTSARR